MKALMKTTKSAKPHEVVKKWHLIDAEGLIVGRLATIVANILRGKHKPSYTPHVDCGDHVVIVNADKVRFTGKKETDKEYFRHTGYPGGVKLRTPKEVRALKPEFIIENAIKGMLPRTKLGRQMLSKLNVYAGPDHEHQAQQPEPLSF